MTSVLSPTHNPDNVPVVNEPQTNAEKVKREMTTFESADEACDFCQQAGRISIPGIEALQRMNPRSEEFANVFEQV